MPVTPTWRGMIFITKLRQVLLRINSGSQDLQTPSCSLILTISIATLSSSSCEEL